MSEPYALDLLTKELEAQSTALVYLPETTSTMEVAYSQGFIKSVVVTDHQTAGRGRYSRQWDDAAGKSILATFVRTLPHQSLPPEGSLLLSHLFVIAIQQAIAQPEVRIKWPNDLMIGTKKLGGVLVSKGESDTEKQAILFGVGLNYSRQSDERKASLDELGQQPNREAIISAINRSLDVVLADLPQFATVAVHDYYQGIWDRVASLLGRTIEISGYGPTAQQRLVGTVVSSPIGGPLHLKLDEGGIIELTDYGHQAHIEVIKV